MDKLFGDGHYTRKEFAIDVAMGVTGVGLVKALTHGAKAARYYRLASQASKADDVILMREAASVGTAYGMSSTIHAGAAYQASRYDSHIGVDNQVDVGVGVTGGAEVATEPVQVSILATRKLTTAIYPPSEKRCDKRFKGKRCRRRLGHTGRHRYG